MPLFSVCLRKSQINVHSSFYSHKSTSIQRDVCLYFIQDNNQNKAKYKKILRTMRLKTFVFLSVKIKFSRTVNNFCPLQPYTWQSAAHKTIRHNAPILRPGKFVSTDVVPANVIIRTWSKRQHVVEPKYPAFNRYNLYTKRSGLRERFSTSIFVSLFIWQ